MITVEEQWSHFLLTSSGATAAADEEKPDRGKDTSVSHTPWVGTRHQDSPFACQGSLGVGPVVRVLVCWHGLWQWAIALAAQLVARSSLCLLLSLATL